MPPVRVYHHDTLHRVSAVDLLTLPDGVPRTATFCGDFNGACEQAVIAARHRQLYDRVSPANVIPELRKNIVGVLDYGISNLQCDWSSTYRSVHQCEKCRRVWEACTYNEVRAQKEVCRHCYWEPTGLRPPQIFIQNYTAEQIKGVQGALKKLENAPSPLALADFTQAEQRIAHHKLEDKKRQRSRRMPTWDKISEVVCLLHDPERRHRESQLCITGKLYFTERETKYDIENKNVPRSYSLDVYPVSREGCIGPMVHISNDSVRNAEFAVFNVNPDNWRYEFARTAWKEYVARVPSNPSFFWDPGY